MAYPVPEKKQTMASYAVLLAQQIDTTQPFVLIGTSIGGMLCTELTDQLQPLKTIIISSAKCRSELPRHYRFQRYIPINKLFGARAIKVLSPIAQAVVEPDRNKHKATFKAMLKAKHPKFLKRAVHMIIYWKRVNYDKSIIHIHGTKDHTLPLRNISPSFIIKDGSHMMTLTRGEEISAILHGILTNK
ncbi:MAG: alpha/beta hydrolase [Saprospiraceae bacterium]|nr:alpha/beta hydrolase [Saprospiraceae bacterium]